MGFANVIGNGRANHVKRMFIRVHVTLSALDVLVQHVKIAIVVCSMHF